MLMPGEAVAVGEVVAAAGDLGVEVEAASPAAACLGAEAGTGGAALAHRP